MNKIRKSSPSGEELYYLTNVWRQLAIASLELVTECKPEEAKQVLEDLIQDIVKTRQDFFTD